MNSDPKKQNKDLKLEPQMKPPGKKSVLSDPIVEATMPPKPPKINPAAVKFEAEI
jgi:hypothetical protein